MKFSIITPTRNCFDTIRRCVGSVRGQRAVDYEHIIQDAGSTDGTLELLRSQRDLNVFSENDEGMYDAINKGWQKSSGGVLSWLNADEQYLPNTLSIVQKVFEEDSSIDIVYGNAIVVDSAGRAIACRRDVPLRAVYIKNSFLYIYSCTMFFRRRLLDNGLMVFNTRYRYAADMDLVLKLLAAKVRHRRVARYLSLFGVDGNNMSSHEGMLKETLEIQAKHGSCRNSAGKKVVTLGRHLEKYLTGAYSRKVVEYEFALDEKPTYKMMKNTTGVGGRYLLPTKRV